MTAERITEWSELHRLAAGLAGRGPDVPGIVDVALGLVAELDAEVERLRAELAAARSDRGTVCAVCSGTFADAPPMPHCVDCRPTDAHEAAWAAGLAPGTHEWDAAVVAWEFDYD